MNGVEGHTFAIFIEDRSNPDDPNDTRTGQDYFSITIYSPAVPYGGTFERNGMVVWGLQGVVYHNQYPLREGNIRAVNTPPGAGRRNRAYRRHHRGAIDASGGHG